MDEFLPRNQPALDERHTATRFEGQVAIVTGGANGIGLGTVERFLNDGADVAIFDIDDRAGAEAVEQTSSASGRKANFYKVDVTDKKQCVDAVEKVVAKYGDVNHLVNSVAYFGSEGLNATKADWERTMSVNVQGYSNMVQACYPHMKKANGGGAAVVNVASTSAFQAQPRRWTYSASKGAVLMMTRNMALDLSKDSIRVNSISPSFTWTRECKKAAIPLGGKQAFEEKYVVPCHMTRRWGETSEMAASIVFLCSRDASFITGTNLAVDGGYGAMGPERHGDTTIYAETKETP